LVNDKAVESTTLGENFCSKDEIMRITNDLVNHPNALDDAEIELKSHAPHIKFVDVNDENRFAAAVYVDLAEEKEERLLQKEKMLDSNSFENIVDRKLKMCAYLFFVFDFNKNIKNFQKYMFLFLILK